MKLKTISIGGATYDLFVRTNRAGAHECGSGKFIAFPLGDKIRVKEVIETCGGGAANTSVGLARLGFDAGFCGIIGTDQWGTKLMDNLKKEGVSVDTAEVVEGEISSFSIILSVSAGERSILYTPGTNIHLHDANFCKEDVKKADWLYLNHIQEGSAVIQDDIIEILESSSRPGFTWNPGGVQLDCGINESLNRKLISLTSLFILN